MISCVGEASLLLECEKCERAESSVFQVLETFQSATMRLGIAAGRKIRSSNGIAHETLDKCPKFNASGRSVW